MADTKWSFLKTQRPSQLLSLESLFNTGLSTGNILIWKSRNAELFFKKRIKILDFMRRRGGGWSGVGEVFVIPHLLAGLVYPRRAIKRKIKCRKNKKMSVTGLPRCLYRCFSLNF